MSFILSRSKKCTVKRGDGSSGVLGSGIKVGGVFGIRVGGSGDGLGFGESWIVIGGRDWVDSG